MLEKAGNEQKNSGSQAQKNSLEKYVFIDYPQENEVISHPHYAIKIGATTNSKIEVSIDKGDWQPCRFAGGHWWYDWTNISAGNHKITARLCDSSGKLLEKTKIRKCLYKI